MSSENISAQSSTTSVQEILQRISAKTSDLIAQFAEENVSEDDKRRLIREHLESECYRLGPNGKIGESLNILDLSIDDSCEWINSKDPVNIKEEACGKMVVVEFFTHCCINCIHSIEDVRHVFEELRRDKQNRLPEDRFCDIKLVSIHSPKFTREKDNESVKSFTKRMNMDHSVVVNDPLCTLWNRFGIFCWPTLLLFGPNPAGTGANLLNVLMGEGHKNSLRTIISSSLQYFDEKLDFDTIHFNPGLDAVKILGDEVDFGSSSILKYPGKVVCNGTANIIAIADSGNNRLLIVSRNGTVKDIIGGVDRGFVNGNFDEARFYNPQGIAFQDDDILYVADTGNHAVRKINLKSRTVITLVSSEMRIKIEGKSVSLRSPWDLAFYGNDVLLVAAAGNHRIFAYFFQDMPLFRVEHEANSFAIIAGSGREENRNNTYILKASFAQPSGIACSQGLNENDKIIYIADSESSTIRYIESGGRVQGLVGGNRDPTDLFAYGDVDGCFLDVKLQHPMGVCSGMGASKIFIADTYNHKIKMIDVESKHATTLIGTGLAGTQLGSFTGFVAPKKRISTDFRHPEGDAISSKYALLNEPGGISIDDQYGLLYIADTNNHAIKVADIRRRIVTELELKFTDSVPATPPVKARPDEQEFPWDQDYNIQLPITCKCLKLEVSIDKVPDSYEGGEWRIKSPINANEFERTGLLEKQAGEPVATLSCDDVPLERDVQETDFHVAIDIFFCGSMSCYRKRVNLHFIVSFINEGNETELAKSDVIVKQFRYEPLSRTYFME